MLNSDLCVRLDTRPAAALVPRFTCPECRVAAYRRAALRAALGMNGGGKVNACPRSSRVRGRRSRVSRGRVSQKSAQAVVYTSRPSSVGRPRPLADRSEEHTSELQSLMRNSYAVFCLKKKRT